MKVDPKERLSAEEALQHPWLRDAPTFLPDLFTEKEKAIILQDYNRLNLEIDQPSLNEPIETDMLLTEHPLDTIQNEDLPVDQRNNQDRSVVLAPYNSLIKLDDTLDEQDLTIDFEPKALKFDRKVKELNR